MEDHVRGNQTKKKSSFSATLIRVLELMAVILSFLGSSHIARFLSAKVTMDLLVEVTDKFGASAGHTLSTVIAAVIAEPMIIAYVVTGVIIFFNILALMIGKIRNTRIRKEKNTEEERWNYPEN